MCVCLRACVCVCVCLRACVRACVCVYIKVLNHSGFFLREYRIHTCCAGSPDPD